MSGLPRGVVPAARLLDPAAFLRGGLNVEGTLAANGPALSRAGSEPGGRASKMDGSGGHGQIMDQHAIPALEGRPAGRRGKRVPGRASALAIVDDDFLARDGSRVR